MAWPVSRKRMAHPAHKYTHRKMWSFIKVQKLIFLKPCIEHIQQAARSPAGASSGMNVIDQMSYNIQKPHCVESPSIYCTSHVLWYGFLNIWVWSCTNGRCFQSSFGVQQPLCKWALGLCIAGSSCVQRTESKLSRTATVPLYRHWNVWEGSWVELSWIGITQTGPDRIVCGHSAASKSGLCQRPSGARSNENHNQVFS